MGTPILFEFEYWQTISVYQQKIVQKEINNTTQFTKIQNFIMLNHSQDIIDTKLRIFILYIRQILSIFYQSINLPEIDNIQQLISSQKPYVDILQLMIPEYQDFYQQLQSSDHISPSQKLSAIINFLQQQIIQQNIQIDSTKIFQGNYLEVKKLLSVLYMILQNYAQQQQEQESNNQYIQQEKNQKSLKGFEINNQNQKQSNKSSQKQIFRNKKLSGSLDNQKINSLRSWEQKKQSEDFQLKKEQIQKYKIQNKREDSQNNKEKYKPIQKIKDISKKCKSKNSKIKQRQQKLLIKKIQQPKNRSKSSIIKIKKSRPQINWGQNKLQKLNQKIKTQKLNCFKQLRQEKLKYVKKMNKIILRLEQNKISQQKQEQQKNKEQKIKKTKSKLIFLQNNFKSNINILKQNLRQANQRHDKYSINKKDIVIKIQKQLKKDKQSQLTTLLDYWQKQKLRIKKLFRQDIKIEQKLVNKSKKQ